VSVLEIGFGVADITPRERRQTIYHRTGNPPDDHVPIRDRLFAHATAFRSGDRLAVWTTLDICLIGATLREQVIAALARQGIRPEHVTLSATHTHTAPTGVHFHGVEHMPEEYVTFLVAEVVRATTQAISSAKPSEIAFGSATADISVNRRQIGRMAEINDLKSPTGLVDPEVNVARIRIPENGRTGLLFNYGAHPLTMRSGRRSGTQMISADYPGRAVLYLQGRAGASHAQFLQGCAGNVNVKISGGEAEADRAGKLLGDAVLKASEEAVVSESADLRFAAETVRLPWGEIPTLAQARETLERIRSTPAGSDDFSARTLEWAEAVVRALESERAPEYAEVLVQAMKLGDAVFVILPGEVFVEIGLQIKARAGIRPLFVVACSNSGEIGNIPTAAAFSEGQDEVDIEPYCIGLFRLSPECERLTVQASLRVIERVTE